MVVHTAPKDGFASISIVDISYLGYSAEVMPLNNPDALRDVPYLPFDGMNEKGLAVGLMAVESADSGSDPAKKTADELLLIRLMLDSAGRMADPFKLLAAVSQSNTVWSAVYDLAGGTLTLAMDRRWTMPYRFRLQGSSQNQKTGR